MRMRRKKHGDARRAALSSIMIPAELLQPGTARSFFERPNAPLHLEIGCGKGDFVIGMAKKYPDINFIAMERMPDIILCAMEKYNAENTPADNVRFLLGNAADLTTYFAASEIDYLYLNFSDPWPKAGHEKRRLTYVSFLEQYSHLLKPCGQLSFKTDNRGLFNYSMQTLTDNGWTCRNVTYDLHKSVWMRDNIETEYERNFSAKGYTIHRVVAEVPPVRTH